MINKGLITALLAGLLLPAVIGTVLINDAMAKNQLPVAHYLQSDAPVFDTTLQQFRDNYNKEYPQLPIQDYHVIVVPNDSALISRAVSKITPQLYSSVVIDKNNKKIKSFQLTYLPTKETESEKAAYATAINYMGAVMCWFNMALSLDQCKVKVTHLLSKARDTQVYQRMDGAVRYIVVEQVDQGITLAIEPVKLVLAEPK
ncbi:MAG: DUF1454 family protein [Enterobacteriaceae bacterium]